MKKIFILLMLLLATQLFANSFENYSLSNLEFIENRGQIADQHGNVNHNVLFIADVPYGTVTIRRDGISYSFVKYDDEIMSKKRNQILSRDFSEKSDEMEFEPIPAEIYRVDMRFNSSNFNPKIEAFEISDDYNNYYLAHCPDGIHYVRKYRTVKMIDVYPDIDFVIYANNDGLVQYDFVVKPGANPNSINFAFEGAENVVITNTGDLRIETPLGRIEQKAPIAYQPNNLANYLNSRDYATIQNIGNNPHSQFIKNSDNSISFALTNYNPAKPLIIDPPTRLWGTYYGGGGSDMSRSLAIDAQGNVFMGGETSSNSNIATEGAHSVNINQYGGDAFLVKFNSDGERLWGTYYGGNGQENGRGTAVDLEGNVYLAGYTSSEMGMSTEGAYQEEIAGETPYILDAFLVKFNSAGVRQWGTYFGGIGGEICRAVATDKYNNVFITGRTTSNEGIATQNAHQKVYGGGDFDAFLAKFNSNGEILWATYYGGNSTETSKGVVTDRDGNVFIAGSTSGASKNAIVTPGAHNTENGSTYLVKFNNNGERIWGTFYAVSSEIYGLAVDSLGNSFISGHTHSYTGIATANAHQTEKGGGFMDAFLAKFSPSGEMQWGTYCGGVGNDYCYGAATDSWGNVFIIGDTRSQTNIATENAHQTTWAGSEDAFLVKFNSAGERQWGTYYGGSASELSNGVGTDLYSNVYIAGSTSSENAIATEGSHQESMNIWLDGYLVKFADLNIYLENISDIHLCQGNDFYVELTIPNDFYENNSFIVQLSDENGSFVNATDVGTYVGSNAQIIYCKVPEDFPIGDKYRIRVISTHPHFSSQEDGFIISIISYPVTEFEGNFEVCSGKVEMYTAVANINYLYHWEVSSGTIIGSNNLGAVLVEWGNQETGNLKLVISSDYGNCLDSIETEILINPKPEPEILGKQAVCNGLIEIYTSAFNNDKILYYWEVTGGTIIGNSDLPEVEVKWDNAEKGILKLIQSYEIEDCKDSTEIEINLYPKPEPIIAGNSNVCMNQYETYSIQNSEGLEILWEVNGGTIVENENSEIITVQWETEGQGEVKVIVRIENTECFGTFEMPITVYPHPTPEITGNFTVCLGAIETYKSNSNDGFDNKWSVFGGEIIGADDEEYVSIKWGTSTGWVIKLVQSYQDTDCKDSVEVNIYVNPLPYPKITGKVEVVERTTEYYETENNAEHSFIWNCVGGNIISGDDLDRVQIKWGDAGQGRIIVEEIINETNCKNYDTLNVFVNINVSVTDGLTSSILKISPNPNSMGTALIELNLPDNGHIAITLYDINGKHIKSIFNDYLHSGTHNFELTTSNFPAGAYIIELTTIGGRTIEKFIISKE